MSTEYGSKPLSHLYGYKNINGSAAKYDNGGCVLTVWFLWGFIP